MAISASATGNHNDLYLTEKYFYQLLDTLIEEKIRIDGLFMNTDACFERIKLRNVFDTVEITPKIAINQKNGSDDENIHVDDLLYYFNRYYKR